MNIGIDPSYAKPIAWAYCAGTWEIGAVQPGSLHLFGDVFRAARDRGVTRVVIEAGYVGRNPHVATMLERMRGRLMELSFSVGLAVEMVHPKTWQAACLSVGRHEPQRHAEIARLAKYRAMGLTGLRLDEDRAVAVCLAEWGDSTL
jgi:Holliday junction resolvasome RuvABC endonuclease subunit